MIICPGGFTSQRHLVSSLVFSDLAAFEVRLLIFLDAAYSPPPVCGGGEGVGGGGNNLMRNGV